MTTAMPGRFDLEIERLLRIRRAVNAFVEELGTLLDRRAFPKSAHAVGALVRELEAELEVNLLRAYDAAPQVEPASSRAGNMDCTNRTPSRHHAVLRKRR